MKFYTLIIFKKSFIWISPCRTGRADPRKCGAQCKT